MADSEAFCGAKLVLELIKHGIDVTVLCLDPTFPLHHPCDDSTLWASLRDVTIRIPTPKNRTFIYSVFMGARYQTITYARWLSAVIKKAHLLNREKTFDLVYSRSLITEAHIAGYWIARRLKLPWIANINDPWDWHLFPDHMKMDYPFLRRIFSNFWMTRTLCYASLVTYPSTRLRDYHYRISGLEHKSAVIPHIGYRHRQHPASSQFCMVHTGKLGAKYGRSSLGLIEGIRIFLQRCPEAEQSFQLLLVGPEDRTTVSSVEKYGLQRIFRTTGMVSYEESLKHISSASVCVLVEEDLTEGIFLPSKLADYAAAKKPILALSPRLGVIADMVPVSGITRVDANNPEAISAAIHTYYLAFAEGSIESFRPAEILVQQYAPDTIARHFIEQANRVLRSHSISKRLLSAQQDSST